MMDLLAALFAAVPGDDTPTRLIVILLAIVFVMVFAMPIRSAIGGAFDRLTHRRLRRIQRASRRAKTTR
jgi:hypothetical protein